ncbi:dTMP kinase [[Mycoplasma] gypis]|uniref:Thymidylate kinase n=1 Tax=[Mycoplasma] gypis TaxID=92404 RepID=A0ABZ2RPA2_9BACT|nr:dTMP kinase [[Mycoplasma] gypis]MBN0919663.1 dTMP kinase [[Mycoplasma] gypis]
MNSKARFITFEGMDGGGKSTVVSMLKDYFAKNVTDKEFLFTREPGSSCSKEAEFIRNFILDNRNNFSPAVDALLFIVSRRINLEKGIWPALDANKIVVSDRYIHSSLIYQGLLGGLGLENIRSLNIDALKLGNSKQILPDIVIYFDMDPQQSLDRITQNRSSLDRLENNNISYYENLRNSYKKLIEYEPELFVVVDASQPLEKVFEDVLEIFKQRVL